LLTLILAESALETIPKQLWKHPVIQRYAEQHKKTPRFTILDRSYHHQAMKLLKTNEKRGRPDIVHFALLEALGSPLNKEKCLTIFVHTINDDVLSIEPQTRLPRNCNRFVSLMEQLFEFKRIPPESERPLLTLRRQNIVELIQDVKPSFILALSRVGKPKTIEETAARLAKEKRPILLVGGFPHGHLSKTTTRLANETICIDREMLETWTVVSRMIYEFERAISLPKKRL
jgi:rRNA small subunit pseudouridine methyltransferase Nep1